VSKRRGKGAGRRGRGAGSRGEDVGLVPKFFFLISPFD